MIFNISNRGLSLRLASIFTVFVIILSAVGTPVSLNGQTNYDEVTIGPAISNVQAFEDCFNELDDDADRFVDGEDADCAPAMPEEQMPSEPQSEPQLEESIPVQSTESPVIETSCDNGFDDDADGFVDGQDSDCPSVTLEEQMPVEPQPEPEPEPIQPAEEICGDGIDNNGDGQTDERCPAPASPTPAELCDNAVDDDGDGLVDGDDSDCPVVTTEPEPQPNPEPDEQPDEPTPEQPTEVPVAEVCDNAVDDDGDGLVDGDDLDCHASSMAMPCPESGNMTGCYPTPKVIPPVVGPCENNGTDCPTSKVIPPVVGPCENNGTDCSPSGVQPPVADQPTAHYTDCPNNATITHCLPPAGVKLSDFNENIAPVANAGEDQEVDENSPVTLDGTSSHDNDGNITSYSWVQTAGDELVTISEADTPNPSFYVPNVASDSTLTFELTIFDEMGFATSDDVNVVVKNVDDSVPLPINGSITLDPIPNTLDEGIIYVFKGQLYIDGVSDYDGRYVQIMDASGESEVILSFGTIDKNGIFDIEWATQSMDSDYIIYALYEGENATLFKSDTYRVAVKPTQLRLENLTYTVTEKPYIDIRFNEYAKNKLNVYINGEEKLIKKYGPDVNHAIQHWKEVLKARTGNYTAWEFKIFNSLDFPRLLETKQYPIDILVNLEHNNNQKECGSGWGGFAYIGWVHRLLNKVRNEPILTRVFTGCGEKSWSHSQVDYVTSHEFAHALGLGHTWNEYGDMMCSTDYARNFRWILQTAEILPRGIRNWIFNIAGIIPENYQLSTCDGAPNNYVDKSTPSEFDIGAVIYAYGKDGFQPPNPRIFANTVYTCEKEPRLCKPSKDYAQLGTTDEVGAKSINIKQPEVEPEKLSVTNQKETTKSHSTDRSTTLDKKESNKLPKTYSYVSSWGTFGSQNGQFDHSSDVAVDASKNILYVTDINNARIQKFTGDGKFLNTWGEKGVTSGSFDQPADVAFDGDFVYVSDINNNRIQKFDADGKYITSWGSFGRGNGQFDHPGAIAVDSSEGIIYVTDIGNHRIQKFTTDGKYLDSWGNKGKGNGQVDRPAGLAFDSSTDKVYVVDTNNNRILVFDKNGNFITKWGGTGSGNGQFNRPTDITVDGENKLIYVADTKNYRIQVFDTNGNFLSKWGTNGDSKGQFLEPTGVAVNPAKNFVYVADKEGNKISMFSMSSSESGQLIAKDLSSAQKFSADLKGSNEVPPVSSKASGTTSFSVSGNTISYRIDVSAIDKVAAAHLHLGESRENGDVVATLFRTNPTDEINGILKEGTIDSADLTGPLEGKSVADLIDLMKNKKIYVNVHSTDFADGEIRGTVVSSQINGAVEETYVECIDNGNIPPCIGEDGSVVYYCDDPRFETAGPGASCIPTAQDWATVLPHCADVKYAKSCMGPEGPVFSCDDPEYDKRKYPYGCIERGQEGK